MTTEELLRVSLLPQILPGLPDPIPDAPLDPLPPDWPCRDEVFQRHLFALRHLLRVPIPPPVKAEGQGVVTVGGGRYWPGVVVAVKMLRRVSPIPVQVWYQGDRESIDTADLAGVPDVSFHDVCKVADPLPRVLGGWQNKTIALLHCGFERALFLDADAYVVANPLPLLNLAGASGFVFWRDHDGHCEDVNWKWYGGCGCGERYPGPVQGGQFAIDLRKAWRLLVIAYWLNQHSDYTYFFPQDPKHDRHGYGDQDTMRVALWATKQSYTCLGRAIQRGPALVCDLVDKAMIVHRVQSKLFWNDKIERTEHLPGDRQVFALLEEIVPNRPA
jgi:hypothetical protein